VDDRGRDPVFASSHKLDGSKTNFLDVLALILTEQRAVIRADVYDEFGRVLSGTNFFARNPRCRRAPFHHRRADAGFIPVFAVRANHGHKVC